MGERTTEVIWRASKLTQPMAKLALLAIAYELDDTTFEGRISLPRFVELMGIPKAEIVTALRQVAAAGEIALDLDEQTQSARIKLLLRAHG